MHLMALGALSPEKVLANGEVKDLS